MGATMLPALLFMAIAEVALVFVTGVYLVFRAVRWLGRTSRGVFVRNV